MLAIGIAKIKIIITYYYFAGITGSPRISITFLSPL